MSPLRSISESRILNQGMVLTHSSINRLIRQRELPVLRSEQVQGFDRNL